MKKISPLVIALFVLVDLFLVGWILAHRVHFLIFDPAGLVADEQKRLFLGVGALGLIIIGTTIAIAFFIVFRYREDNEKIHVRFNPDWTGSKKLILLFWAFPAIIIFGLGIITWQTTHTLDPYKPLAVAKKPLTIQVVSLQWKWLFIYPEQHIATVNFVAFPAQTPLTFELTADSPMNSFWIPQLGGQIYSMSGMSTKTHLMADAPGEFAGKTAEINGAGYEGMKFTAKAMTDADFAAWVDSVKQSSQMLDKTTYETLAQPTEDVKPIYYSSVEDNLYNTVMMKFMPSSPSSQSETQTMPDMHMY